RFFDVIRNMLRTVEVSTGNEFHDNTKNRSMDDIASLSDIFNEMSMKILNFRSTMESKIQDKTSENEKIHKELQKLNRIFKVISSVNRAIVHLHREEELLNAICNILVIEGEYRLAWIGFAEHDERKTIRPVAYAGFEEGYLDKAKFVWADTDLGRCPAGTAIRTGVPVICQDFLNSSDWLPCREEAVKLGYASMIALPLINHNTFGALNIYSATPNTFEGEEKDLILEIWNDVNYGILTTRNMILHRKAEEALRESESKYKMVVETAAEGILMTSVDTKQFLYVNLAICKMLKYTEEELLQLSITDIHPKEYRDNILAEFNAQSMSEKVLIEVPCLRKDNTVFYVSINAVPIISNGRKCVVSFFTDITARKNVEKNLVESKIIAEATTHAKDQFIANVSHELRTPLNSVIGFSTLMIDNYSQNLDEKQKKYLNFIKTSGEQLLSLIDTILNITKVDLGNVELQYSNFLLKDFFNNVLCLLHDKILLNQIKISVEVSEDADQVIIADEKNLKQVLYPIVLNAIKFSPSGSEVILKGKIIHHSDKVPMVEISVIDDGIGISVENLEKIFSPFSQIDISITKRFPGMGLGLVLAKKLVEMQGGNIRAESEGLKHGSTFKFTFPFKKGQQSL
ncbi:MAG: hypothetical protein ACD_79C00600G0001, partial [uncultured bacterium]